MALGGQKESGYNLVNVGTLTLETSKALETADLEPRDIIVDGEMLIITDKCTRQVHGNHLYPAGIIVDGEMLMITYWNTRQVHVCRRHDGKLLSTLQLEAFPSGICCVNDREICIALDNGTIQIMSVKDTGVITRDTIFNLKTPLDECYGVGKFMDKVVVSGVKQDTVCWCVVSRDGHVDAIHNICEGSDGSFLTTTKTNMVYISCYGSRCVYGYNILNPRQQRFTYRHEGPWMPFGISVDEYGYLFVCDNYRSINHLTDKCQLVTKYMVGIRNPYHHIPYTWAIFWDHGILYVTDYMSNKITLFKPEYPHINKEFRLEDDVANLRLDDYAANGKSKQKHVDRRTDFGTSGIHESVLRNLSKDLIARDWKFFFRDFSVTDRDIEQVEIDYRHNGIREQIYQLLCRSNRKGRLNKTSVIEALKSIDRDDLIHVYSKMKF